MGRTTMKERPLAVHGGCVTHTERAVGPGPLVSTSEGPSRAWQRGAISK